MKTVVSYSLLVLLLFSCNDNDAIKRKQDAAKQEILKTEKAFEKLAAEEGLKIAFTHFGASDAVINRNDSIHKGLAAIASFYARPSNGKIKLSWTPDFIDVSASCDLAYTYGKYTFQITDSSGNTNEIRGIFHTVWKKQKDGTWRFVWD
jgi:ketosteroid isomerase-like protein